MVVYHFIHIHLLILINHHKALPLKGGNQKFWTEETKENMGEKKSKFGLVKATQLLWSRKAAIGHRSCNYYGIEVRSK